MVSNYELKRISKKEIDSKSHIVEGEKTLYLVEEHPSHKYMVMSKRNNIIIPCINNLNLLQNVEDLRIDSIITEVYTSMKRENIQQLSCYFSTLIEYKMI